MRVFSRVEDAAGCVRQGGVLAYPTEAVFGLGCHWQQQAALERILQLKKRSVEQGVIVLVADETMLAQVACVDDPRLQQWHAEPGITWLLPPGPSVPDWIRGQHTLVAVRIPAWSWTQSLVKLTGPLVSTSANPSGQPPARNSEQVRAWFDSGLDGLLDQPCGTATRPSRIQNAITGERLR